MSVICVIGTCRYGFKMMLDQVLMGEATTPGEFEEYLVEFDRDWYIGLEKEEDWKSSVLNSVPNLFSLGHNKAQVMTKSTGEKLQHFTLSAQAITKTTGNKYNCYIWDTTRHM